MKTLKEKTASGLFWGVMSNGSTQILTVVIGIVLARLLSTADYGLVGMLAMFTAIAGALQESGFTSALVNLDKPEDNDYNSVFWFSLLMGLSLYALLFLCAPLIAMFFHQPKLIELSKVAFLTIPISAIGIVPQAYLFKNLKVKETTYIRITANIVMGVVGITMALNGNAYWSLVWQQITYTLITSFGKFLLIPWRPSLHIDFSPVKRMFGFSCKIMFSSIVNTISNNILTFIFGRLFSAGTVGNFSQASKWNTTAHTLVSGTVAQVAQPVFISVGEDNDRLINVFRKMIRFTAFLAFPVMFGLAIISQEFIIIAIGKKWIDSIALLQILCNSASK
jgi:teichuronic acid exporter